MGVQNSTTTPRGYLPPTPQKRKISLFRPLATHISTLALWARQPNPPAPSPTLPSLPPTSVSSSHSSTPIPSPVLSSLRWAANPFLQKKSLFLDRPFFPVTFPPKKKGGGPRLLLQSVLRGGGVTQGRLKLEKGLG